MGESSPLCGWIIVPYFHNEGAYVLSDKQKNVPRPLVLATAVGVSVAAAVIGRWQLEQYALARMTMPGRSLYRADPADFGLSGYERVNLTTNDGVVLRGRFFPAYGHRGHNTTNGSSAAKGSVILLHGYASNHEVLFEYVVWLVAAGYNVLAYDQRGNGQSDGDRITLGYQEAHDVGAAVEWLQSRGQRNIAAYGFSMGGSVAILAAAEYNDIKAVITDCAYATLREAVKSRLLEMGYNRNLAQPLSSIATVALDRYLQAEAGEFDAIRAVNWLSPRLTLFIHAGADMAVDPSDAYALYDAAGEPRELWITPRSAHTASYHDYPQEYKQKVLATLALAFAQA